MRYKLLNKINIQELNSTDSINEIRIAVKGIIKNNLNEILMIRLETDDDVIIKLPGGGVENNETYESALIREIKEETGFSICKISQFGCSLDFVEEWNIGIVTIFMEADLEENKKKSSQNLTDLEKNQNLTYEWLSIKSAILKIRENKKNFYSSLISNRDLNILLKYDTN